MKLSNMIHRMAVYGVGRFSETVGMTWIDPVKLDEIGDPVFPAKHSHVTMWVAIDRLNNHNVAGTVMMMGVCVC
jgi:hypothetical protein